MNAAVIAIAINPYLVKPTRTGENTNVCVSVIRYRIHRAAGNGLGRGRPTRERGQ